MATGRTLNRWTRVYYHVYNVCGLTRSIGPLSVVYDAVDEKALCDEVSGALPALPNISPGTLNGIFDTAAGTTLSLADVGSAAGSQTPSPLTIAIGIRAAPAAGDPVFCGYFNLMDYTFEADNPGVAHVSLPFGMWNTAYLKEYQHPWGNLLHAYAAATAANSSGTGVDGGAATSYGGYMVYHTFGGDGTATIKVQHSVDEVDGNYADLGGCTSGEIDFTTNTSGYAATTTTTTTVNQYTRWQIALNGATTVTFVLSFVRGIRPL